MKIKTLSLALLLSLGALPATGHAAEPFGKLLMKNAWCSVRPAPDGRRIRIVFHADGHYVLTTDHRGNEGHWRVTGRTLYMGEDGKTLEPVASGFRQPRRGRVVLFVDGEEFVRCK